MWPASHRLTSGCARRSPTARGSADLCAGGLRKRAFLVPHRNRNLDARLFSVPTEDARSACSQVPELFSLNLRISRSVDLWQDSPCRNQSANRKNRRIGKSAILRKQLLLFSSKQRESSLSRATRLSAILVQVAANKRYDKLGTMRNIHRWGFIFIAIGIVLWMSGVSPKLGSIVFVIGLVGLVIAWVIR